MKYAFILASSLIAQPLLANTLPATPEAVTSSYAQAVQSKQTYTYVRCWYRPSESHNDPATQWQWAQNPDGSDYSINGYWWSSVSFKNMFYTDVSQATIQNRCEETLGISHENADILFYAADNRLSYNHTIWSNDSNPQGHINQMVAFGDSLSDTGNLFNGSQWTFPNANSWFLGHFSNGLVWTEYLAKNKNIPLYNWAVGGAAGTNQYMALTGVYDQVTSYLTYMKMAKHYDPAQTLFTLEFGLNDFMNYDRSLEQVEADFSSALSRLHDAGAHNLILLTLPDATKAPQFKYSTPEEIAKVRANILAFNAFIKAQAALYTKKDMNIGLFDANTLFNEITTHPKDNGFENASDACLDIQRSSSLDYLYSHRLTDECAYYGSDKYVFWGVTHPTTATHKYIADKLIDTTLKQFDF
ncbi:SGNH/GDSL hydrolase family protein [Vibrio profundum]|uniref:SGNH/GDSL hydrolase family protein n=1 Tax=Vibrio profundum TaxID=2910247 RepID=UPI003D131E0B